MKKENQTKIECEKARKERTSKGGKREHLKKESEDRKKNMILQEQNKKNPEIAEL